VLAAGRRVPIHHQSQEDAVHEHPLILIYLTLMAIASAIAAAIATRVQVLPDVIDLTLIPTGSGLASLTLVAYEAVRRFEPERIGRLSLLGTLVGGGATTATIMIALLADVLS
jgi:hypothetical protein